MLLFIPVLARKSIHNCAFQNISCYCLSGSITKNAAGIEISKHLMLLFISLLPSVRITILQFQNISCYCLSLPWLVLLEIVVAFQNISCYCLSIPSVNINAKNIYFKTSHVIVYRGCGSNKPEHNPFQNISCYCLSSMACFPLSGPLVFQNISCYCLSNLVEQYELTK